MTSTPPLTVLLFGATGSAGGSVLRTCLASPHVREVRVIARRAIDLSGEKLRVHVHSDFLEYTAVADAFAGVDACFFCLGISATQVASPDDYQTITHDFPLAAAGMLKAKSPAAAFHYISGRGAHPDSRMMWARVKAETERDLLDLVDAVSWRPAFIDGADSVGAPRAYQLARPIFRLLSPFRSLYVRGDDIGRAMLQATVEQLRGAVVENAEIRRIAKRATVGP
jgi:uncharacterized protein YbjT (DUF2867 family)